MNHSLKSLVLCLPLALLAMNPAMADEQAAQSHHMVGNMPPGMDMPMPATNAPADVYAGAMAKMHKDMMVAPTGDADVDFVRGMIPHHQGAVDMAKIELDKGKDPEIKKFAQGIIDAQEKEIAFMKGWLAKHPAAAK